MKIVVVTEDGKGSIFEGSDEDYSKMCESLYEMLTEWGEDKCGGVRTCLHPK